MKMNKLLKGAMAGAVLSTMLLGGVVGASASTTTEGGNSFVKTSVFSLSSTSEVASLSDTTATSTDVTKKDIDWTSEDLSSNNDEKRRAELEKQLGIKLTDKHVWKDKKGEFTTNPDGTKSEYTSHDEMKKLGFYAVNANRQELIQYGIQTGDWQPYRAFEAKDTPLYFELVDGKYEYSKIYYANSIELYSGGIGATSLSPEEAEKERQRVVKELIEEFKKAPGIVPYVIGLNGNEAQSKASGIPEPDEGYFDGKYNDPSVKSFGKFTENK